MRSRSRPWLSGFLGAVVAIVAIFASPEVLAAADPTPLEPSTSLALPEQPPPESITIPVPDDVTAGEAQAVESRQTDTLRQVGDGDVTIAEATRDPAEAPDPGAGATFWVVGILAGALSRPIVNLAVANWPAMPNEFSGAIHFVLLLLFYVGAWAIAHRSNPSLPQDWQSWVGAAIAATGGGTVASSSAKGTSAARGRA